MNTSKQILKNMFNVTMTKIFFDILACSIVLNGVCSSTIRDKLKGDLLRNYDSDVRPYCNNNEVVNVTLDMALRQLIEMYEPLQIIKANIWIRMKWKDCRLAWNASDYAGITNLLVPFAKLWVPDLTLYDNTGETFFGKRAFTPSIFSDGTIYYNFPSVVDNRCIIDISKFPYDSQVCKFVFGSWAYHGNEIDFIQKNPTGDLTTVEENVEWHITSMPAERHVVYYNCCPEPYPDITFYVYITRKPGFYIINILIPYFLITGVSVFGFLLPCESGEKVSLEITVMLSLAVFQTLVADSLPPSSDNVPLLAIYFDFSMSLVGFATIIAVIVNNLYFRENQKIPKVIKVIFLDYGCKITFVQNPREKHNKGKTNGKDKNNQTSSNNAKDKQTEKDIAKEDKQVSKLKLSCTRLRSIICGNKKPDNFTESTETLTQPASRVMNVKIGSGMTYKSKDPSFKKSNGFFENLSPISTVDSVDNGLKAEIADNNEIVTNRNNVNPKANEENYKSKTCNGIVSGTDEIEEILDLPNSTKNMQNNKDGQNVTSINIRPHHLPSISSKTDGQDDNRKKKKDSKKTNHIETNAISNMEDVKQSAHTDGKHDTHTEMEEQWDKIEKTLKHIDSKISRSAEWKALAVVIDRLSFYCFILAGIIGMIVIFVLLH